MKKRASGVFFIVRQFLLVALFALFSCVSPRPCRAPSPARFAIQTPVWIDARFPPDSKEAIEHALGRWNAALGGARVFFLASDDVDRPHEWLSVGAHPLLGWGATFTYNEASPLGTDGLLAQVRAESDVQFYADHFNHGEPYEAVALHEIGHVLGLDDGEPGARLMISRIAADQGCIDKGTIARLARRHPTWTEDLRAECN